MKHLNYIYKTNWKFTIMSGHLVKVSVMMTIWLFIITVERKCKLDIPWD